MEPKINSFITNKEKIYFIDLHQNFDIHRNIINKIIEEYTKDSIDFHVAYVPHEHYYKYDYDKSLTEIHTYLEEKLKKLKKSEKLEMSIVYNTHIDDNSRNIMSIKNNDKIITIQQYSRADNRIQLVNNGSYKYDNQIKTFKKAISFKMFPGDQTLLRTFLSSVANENNYKNSVNRNGGVYYKFVYTTEIPTLQKNKGNNIIEHAVVPYNKFRIELNKDDGKIKNEKPYEFPSFVSRNIIEKGQRFANNLVNPLVNAANYVTKATENSEEKPPAGGKTRKHRKRKMRSSKRKASKKGRKSRKKKSSSKKKK